MSRTPSAAGEGLLHQWFFFSAFLVLAMSVVWVFSPALATAIRVWTINEAFHHGFLVLPLSIWGFISLREELDSSSSGSFPAAGILLLTMGLLLFVGWSTQIVAITQLSFYFAVLSSFVAGFGARNALRCWFPLGVLFFGIPLGEELVPFLQQITTSLASIMLRLFGVTMFVDDNFINTPVGVFHVAEACSGVKFLIAGLFFGFVLAFVCFERPVRRLYFLCFCLVMPILANSLRVFVTVKVGIYFGVENVAGFDHIVYGWVLFALIFVLFLYVALRYGDRSLEKPKKVVLEGPKISWYRISVPIAVTLFSWIALNAVFDSSQHEPKLMIGTAVEREDFENSTGILLEEGMQLQKLDESSFLLIQPYRGEFDMDLTNRLTIPYLQTLKEKGLATNYQEFDITPQASVLEVSQWYRIGNGSPEPNDLKAKLKQLRNALTKGDISGDSVYLITQRELGEVSKHQMHLRDALALTSS